MPTIPQKIYDLIEYGFKTDGWPEYNEWAARAQSFLETVFPNEAARFASIHHEFSVGEHWQLARASQIGLISGDEPSTHRARAA
jgi:hypothetical protein